MVDFPDGAPAPVIGDRVWPHEGHVVVCLDFEAYDNTVYIVLKGAESDGLDGRNT
ncbi:hypothetical protein B0G76_6750 [Paraburkholderia sp. BL23I1N1]|nr:hypothetical protein B0G76_6750 [Paraburkholderia sp. BL23I1N1]